MNIHLLARRTLKSSPAVLAAALVLGGSAAAGAPNTIEGVWSFNGGSVAIQQLSNGTFQGTVVTTTQFAECQHAVGQVMWTSMSQRPDGSFWGFHQWYRGACEPDPQLGPTTWRVLYTATGARYLKVCFSHPGTSQPKIAPDGADTEATYGCVNSALVASLPTVSGTSAGGGSGRISFRNIVLLPASKGCTRQKSLTIKLRDPRYDPLKEVVIKINGKRVADVRGVKRFRRGVTLRRLPGGTYKISVVATTVLRQRLSGSRTYRSCAGGSGKIKLHRRVK